MMDTHGKVPTPTEIATAIHEALHEDYEAAVATGERPIPVRVHRIVDEAIRRVCREYEKERRNAA